MGLEKFKHVIYILEIFLTVDKGFANEVFYVFQNKYHQIKIEYTKSNNDDVQFMIDRSLPSPE